MAQRRLLWQLFPSFVLITILALVAVTWYATGALRDFHLRHVADDLEARTRLIRERIESRLAADESADLTELVVRLSELGRVRVTLISPSGYVLADSEHDPEAMLNHKDRPEIIDAMEEGRGYASRLSPTLQEKMMYFALPIHRDGQLIMITRAAIPVNAVDDALAEIYGKMLLCGIGVSVLAALLCLYISRRISRPIEQMRHMAQKLADGHLDATLPKTDTTELSGLALTLNQMARQLHERIETVTAQRNEFEALLASMVEAVWAVDADGNVLAINQTAADLFGVDAGAVQGHSVPELARNADLQKFVDETLASSEPTEKDIVFHRLGQTQVFQAHGAVLADSHGKKRGAVIVLHDITRIRQLENLRCDFAANVSHELKTPITSIKGFVETLLEDFGKDPEQTQRFLTIIARQTDRLNAIVEDLLSLSGIEEASEKGRVELEPKPVRTVLDAAVELAHVKADNKQIRLEVECEADVEVPLNADLLEQAVFNLVDNAIKYSPEGATVKIRAQVRGDNLEIQVEDQGMGIPAEHVERIFERFYVVDKARSRNLGGTGLGLAIVKHIAQAHHGKVSVASKMNSGSVFTISLPVRAAD
ncbi:MAG: PAS domain S-box protein [Sedimentisphaerales bacterium]|nr:PAS domain S-box protein [Sedimentisphaerales bacterium]